MKNIYDIRKEENLLFVLPSEDEMCTDMVFHEKVAVIINLYYLYTLDKYIAYINKIPYGITAYIYSSNPEVLKSVKSRSSKKDIVCTLKENRGRDISTLLVAASKVVKQYDYVCFIHDKCENADYLKEDVNNWITNLWENMLSSAVYIKKIIDILDEKKDLGILVPPEPYGKFSPIWYGDTWQRDFELTKKLAGELNLEADIDFDKEVFGLGTVFWAKTVALKKLYNKDWNYTDFPCEPMPTDGTISHAIERIFCYVAQDAGYKTGTVMTARYASWLLLNVQEDMRTLFFQMKKRLHIQNLHQAENLDQQEKMIKNFVSVYHNIYIFGAGNYGTSIYKFMEDRKWNCNGFIVSDGKRKERNVWGKTVWEIREVRPSDDTGVIIGVSYEYRKEIEKLLDVYGFKNYIYVF